MSFPGPNQPPSNGGGNKPNGGNNPFTNPFSRNNDGKNGGNGANGNKSNGPRPFWQSPWLWVVVVALLAVTMFQLFAGAGSQTIDTKDGMQILNGNTVEYATIVDNTQQVKLKLSSDYSATDPDTGRTKNYGKNVQFYYTYAQSAAVVKAVQKADPAKGWTASMQQTSIWTYLLTSLLPFLIIFGLFWFLMSRMGGAAGGMFGMGGKKNSGKLLDGQTPTTKFSDVAGEDAAVQEVEEIKDFLKDPSRYKALGARIPRGVLLYGPPGTGKTLLARAIAGEAGVPFYSMAGSDFVEMFVGVGASRVRDLFEQAKQKAPCILFIDEIDAIGRARGKNAGFSGNDERENTLNQLLTEMDGFQTNTGVIVLAATNRADILDKALMRAGRFDRQIEVGLPDVKEREEIFDVHLRPLKLDPELDRTFLAKQTPGFSGADIANVCNEAALIAARHNKKYVSREDFLAAIDRIIGGLERKNKIISDEEKRVIAYHEAGHATVSWILENASPLIKVTIIPRGKSLGAAWYLPEERQITTREQMMDELAATLGGRVSEQLTFGEISTGALNDLERATKMAYAMVAYYGMSEKVGTISYYDSTGQSDMALTKPYSELTAQQIDAEAKNTIAEAYAMAAEVLRSHADGLKELAELLLEREVVFTEDVERIFGKRKKDILRERKEAEQKALAERKAASGDAEEAAGKKEVASAEPRKDEEKISGTAASAVSDGKSSAETPEV